MDLTLILFGLRCLSGLVLLALLTVLLILLWRDYQRFAVHQQTQQRVYGRLVALIRVDDAFTETGESHALLPMTSIGRAPTNSILIQDGFASSDHALIALRQGQWWLEDRGSRNGTLLNDEPVTKPVIITDGDLIGIGQVYFRVVLE